MQPQDSAIFQLKHISVAYDHEDGPRPVLKDVDFSLAAGRQGHAVGQRHAGHAAVPLRRWRVLPPRHGAQEQGGGFLIFGSDRFMAIYPVAPPGGGHGAFPFLRETLPVQRSEGIFKKRGI